jgi:hypothetical protein
MSILRTDKKHSISDGLCLNDADLKAFCIDNAYDENDVSVEFDSSFVLRVWRRISDSWDACQLRLEIDGSAKTRYAVAYKNGIEIKRALVEVTSYALETNLAANSFELVTTSTIMHFSARTIEEAQFFVLKLKDFISKSTPFPRDSLLKETLIRYPGESYHVIFKTKTSLGLAFDKSPGEWANVRVSKNENIRIGSVLSGINGNF